MPAERLTPRTAAVACPPVGPERQAAGAGAGVSPGPGQAEVGAAGGGQTAAPGARLPQRVGRPHVHRVLQVGPQLARLLP